MDYEPNVPLLRLPCAFRQARLRVQFFTMIGTIRKHSSWLWWIIAGLTIISFVVFMGSGPRAQRRRPAVAVSARFTASTITAAGFPEAQREFYMYYWMRIRRSGRTKSPASAATERSRKFTSACCWPKRPSPRHPCRRGGAGRRRQRDFLRSLGRNGQPCRDGASFSNRSWQPEGLGVADLENFSGTSWPCSN